MPWLLVDITLSLLISRVVECKHRGEAHRATFVVLCLFRLEGQTENPIHAISFAGRKSIFHIFTSMAKAGPWGASLRAGALLLASMLLAAAAEENAPGTTGLLEASVGGKRTLVIADGPQIEDSHSMFFSALKVRTAAASCITASVELPLRIIP